MNTLEVTFRISNVCNIDCKYCHWNKLHNYKLEDIKKTIDKIYELAEIKNIEKMSLYFHGGEPSFHPNIIEILQYINSKDSSFKVITNLQTNLSLSTKLYLDILKEVEFISVTIHYKYLNQKKLLPQFLKNLYKINSSKKIKLFDIMLEELELEEIPKFQSLIKVLLKTIHFESSEMIYSFCHYRYNRKIRDIHKKFYEQYSVTKNKYFWKDTIMTKEMDTNEMFKGVDFTNSMCKAGNNYLIIEGNGLVFRCGSHMTNYIKGLTGSCPDNIGPSEPVGNMLTDDISKFNLPDTQCQWKFCGGDFYIPKYPKKIEDSYQS